MLQLLNYYTITLIIKNFNLFIVKGTQKMSCFSLKYIIYSIKKNFKNGIGVAFLLTLSNEL